MKKTHLFVLLTTILLALWLPIATLASDVSDALWLGIVRVTNSSGATVTNGVATASISSQSLIDNGNCAADFSDIAVQYNSSDIAFGPSVNATYPWSFEVPSIGNGQNIDFRLYTGGASGGKIRYFPDDAGMEVDDNDTYLEPGDNFSQTFSGYVDTDAGADKNLVYKQDAVSVYVDPSTSGTINADIFPDTVPSINDQTQRDTGAQQYNGHDYGFGERIDDFPICTITQVSFYLAKYGTPTGNATATLIKVSDNTTIATFGTTNVADLDATPNFTWVNFTGSWANDTVQDVRLRINYAGGDSSNFLHVGYQSTDVWSYGVYTDQSSGVWVDGTGDLTFKLYMTITPSVSVFATGVSSGEHDITVATDNGGVLFGIGVDKDPQDYFPSTNNLILNLPLPHTDMTGSPITSKDAYGHSCTVAGATWTAQGLYFDGTNDNIVVPHNAVFPGTGDNFTLTVELKMPTAPGAGAAYHIAGKWDGAANSTFLFQVTQSVGQFVCYIGGLALDNASRLSYAAYLDTWVYLTIVWDGTNNSIYANGVFKDAADTPASPVGVADDIYIGERAAGTNDLKAYIGEISLYGRAFTPAEVLADYEVRKWRYDGTVSAATESSDYFQYNVSAAVPDNGNDWTFFENGSMPYVESLDIEVDGVPAASWNPIWEYSTTFTDSENDIEATPSFRDSSTSGLSASLISFAPVSQSQISTFDLSHSYSILSGSITATSGMYESGTYDYIPGADAVNEILDDTEVPRAAWWLPFIFFGMAIIAFLVYGGTTVVRGPNGSLYTGQIDGSLLLMFIVIEALLVLWSRLGVVDLWPAYLFPIAGIAITLSRKHLAWG